LPIIPAFPSLPALAFASAMPEIAIAVITDKIFFIFETV
jgi:hypothetical protein